MRAAVICLLLCAGAPAHGDVHGAPLPRGAKKLAENHYTSPKGFAATVKWYEKELRRRGIAAKVLPVEQAREITYCRILSEDRAVPWLAIHIMLADGRTTIYIVGSKSLGDRLTVGRKTLDSCYLGSNPSPRTTKLDRSTLTGRTSALPAP